MIHPINRGIVIAAGTLALFAMGYRARAQAPAHPPQLSVVDQGQDERTWKVVVGETDESGATRFLTNSFTELCSGLNYLDAKGQWQESREAITVQPSGTTAVAAELPYKVILTNDLASGSGAVDLRLPDGQRLLSTPRGLAYFDAVSGKSAWIAEVRSLGSAAQLSSANELVWTNALDTLSASIRYRVTRAQFEQDVILHEQPPSPTALGLTPANPGAAPSAHVYLEFWTEFLQSPTPEQVVTVLTHTPVADDGTPLASPDYVDEQLQFAPMQTGLGRIFLLFKDASEPLGITTAKRWVHTQDQRTLLIESIAYLDLLPYLATLPLPAVKQAALPAAPRTIHEGHIPPCKVRKFIQSEIVVGNFGRRQ